MTDTSLQRKDPYASDSMLSAVATHFGVQPGELYSTLANTIFPSKQSATKEQVTAFLIVAKEHNLSPFTKEIYAFPGKGGAVVPIVSIDGWLKMANDHPQFDGIQTAYDFDGQGNVTACTATVYRKDRAHPTVCTELVAECRRNTDPWKNQPSRMIRHRAVIQAIRMAFSFSGIYEPDEAARFAAAVPTDLEERGESFSALAPAEEPAEATPREAGAKAHQQALEEEVEVEERSPGGDMGTWLDAEDQEDPA